MTYAKPDRSTYTPNFSKSAENDQLDIGWAEGVMKDGRPYRLECWAQDQLTCVTVFLSSAGLESATTEALLALLEVERVIWWRPGATPSAGVSGFIDSAGETMWSINIVIGLDGEKARADSVPLQAYEKRDSP